MIISFGRRKSHLIDLCFNNETVEVPGLSPACPPRPSVESRPGRQGRVRTGLPAGQAGNNWSSFLNGTASGRSINKEKTNKVSLLSGFTLIEIMLVVVIIGALAAMVIPRLTGRSEQAKVAVAKADIDSHISTALKLYELDNGSFPTTSQGLDALLEKPVTSPIPSNWSGPYIERKPIDPWGRPYFYASPGENRPDFDLYSKGKNETTEEDDITNW